MLALPRDCDIDTTPCIRCCVVPAAPPSPVAATGFSNRKKIESRQCVSPALLDYAPTRRGPSTHRCHTQHTPSNGICMQIESHSTLALLLNIINDTLRKETYARPKTISIIIYFSLSFFFSSFSIPLIYANPCMCSFISALMKFNKKTN